MNRALLGALVFKLHTPNSLYEGAGSMGGGCLQLWSARSRAWGHCQSMPFLPFWRQSLGILLHPRLAWNLLFCFSFSSAGFTGICRHSWPSQFLPQRKGPSGRIQLDSVCPSCSHSLNIIPSLFKDCVHVCAACT